MRPNAAINVSVTNHYGEPSYKSEVISQGILGEMVEILETREPFTLIRQADGYESWISTDQVAPGDPPAGTSISVRSHFVRIHQNPNVTSPGIKEAVIGSTLMAMGEKDAWFHIALPGGETGWAEKKHFKAFPSFSPENVISLAKEFLGYQYTWGGRSPKGFDCSGLVQTVFRLHGVDIPRDSWQQQQHGFLSKDYRDAGSGDLLFFGKTPERVTHVAISLGDERFIHASGWVRLNSFCKSDEDFSPEHLKKFISVNRYPI